MYLIDDYKFKRDYFLRVFEMTIVAGVINTCLLLVTAFTQMYHESIILEYIKIFAFSLSGLILILAVIFAIITIYCALLVRKLTIKDE